MLKRLVLVACAAWSVTAVQAQQLKPSNQFVSPALREQFREEVNESALFLMGGPLGQSDINYASDISVAVNGSNKIRVLPIVGSAAAQNVKDVLYLRGVDLALTDTTTLNVLQQTNEVGPGLSLQITYIAVLYAQEMHVVAGPDLNSLEELRGKRINFDVEGSGSALHLPDVFKRLNIDVQPVHMTQSDALEKMRRGELDATACICAKPVDAFISIPRGSGFKLIGIPYAGELQRDLLPATVTVDDYPGIVAERETIETVATTAVLVSFNWPKGSARYERTARFVDTFFTNFSQLLVQPRQPGWRTVNIAATLPGWQRFVPAQEWLERNNKDQDKIVRSEFTKFAADRGIQTNDANPASNNGLFREFLEWKSRAEK